MASYIWAYKEFVEPKILKDIGEQLHIEVKFGSDEVSVQDKHFQIAQTNVKVFIQQTHLLELQNIVRTFIKAGFGFNKQPNPDRLIFTFGEASLPQFPLMIDISGINFHTRVFAKSKSDVLTCIINHNKFTNSTLTFEDCLFSIENNVLFPFDLLD